MSGEEMDTACLDNSLIKHSKIKHHLECVYSPS